MRKTKITIALITLLIAGTALQLVAQDKYAKSFSISRHNFVDTIKIEIWKGAIIIPAEINGSTKKLLFDTGAEKGFWVADMEEWMTPIDSITIVDSNKERQKIPLYQFPPIKIGSTTIENYTMVISESFKNYVCGKIDGALGFNLVAKGLSIKFDTKDSLMIVTDRKGFFAKEEKKHTVLKYYKDTRPDVLIQFPYGKYRMTFDSGYIGGWVDLPQYWLDKWSSNNPKMKEAIDKTTVRVDTTIKSQAGLLGKTQDTIVARTLHIPGFGVGDAKFEDFWLSTGNRSMLIGSCVLKHASLIINAQKQHLVFLPHNENSGVVIGNEDFDDFRLFPTDGDSIGALKVIVREGSKEYQKGIRTGDYLISADGVPITDYCTYSLLKQKGKIKKMVFRTPEGEDKEVEWDE